MTTNAVLGQGTLIKRGDAASPEAFTTIPEVGSISGPSRAFDILDVTTQESSGNTREKKAGLIDPGEITFDIKYLVGNAVHAGMLSDHTNRTLRNFQMVFPDSPEVTWAFSAFVSQFALDVPVDDIRMANVTLTLTGTIGIS